MYGSSPYVVAIRASLSDRHPEGYHVGYVSFDVSQLGRKKGRYTFTSRANVDEVINCTSTLITRSPIKSCVYKL